MSEQEVWTYSEQPGESIDAFRLGDACMAASSRVYAGDSTDRGLVLLQELERRGYGIVKLPDGAEGR